MVTAPPKVVTVEELTVLLHALMARIKPDELCEFGGPCGQCDGCSLAYHAKKTLQRAEDQIGL